MGPLIPPTATHGATMQSVYKNRTLNILDLVLD